MAERGDLRLERALRDLAAALNATGARWMVIGGIAMIARGVRRFTADIDAAVLGDEIDIKTLLAALAKRRIRPRITRAEQFARKSLVLLLRHQPSGVDFDLSFAWTDFEHEAIAAATVASFGAVKAPMARPGDLLVLKAIAGRGKDLDDMTALLTLYSDLDLTRARAQVRALAELAGAPELAAGLEEAIEASNKVRKAAAPARPRRTAAKGAAQRAQPEARAKSARSATGSGAKQRGSRRPAARTGGGTKTRPPR